MKRTKRGIKHESDENKGESEEKKTTSTSEEEKKASADKKEEEQDQQSDGEDESADSKKKKKSSKDEKSSGEQGWGQRIYGFFMEPNGGGPNYENWFKVFVLGGLATYYGLYSQPPSQEITYMDFVH